MPNVGTRDQRDGAKIPQQKGLYERSGDLDRCGHHKSAEVEASET
jgi:hypothetical protein